MSQNPMLVIAVVTSTIIFQALLYGSEIAEKTFPEMMSPAVEDSDPNAGMDCGGAVDATVCALRSLGAAISSAVQFMVNFFSIIFGALTFFLSLITFNVPGAPWYVRVLMGSIFGGSILWSVVAMLRASK